MSEMTATLKYDFRSASWLAVADWDNRLASSGTTPEEAVQTLASECNRHELWPR